MIFLAGLNFQKIQNTSHIQNSAIRAEIQKNIFRLYFLNTLITNITGEEAGGSMQMTAEDVRKIINAVGPAQQQEDESEGLYFSRVFQPQARN